MKCWHLKTFLQIFVLWNIIDSQYIIHGRMSHFFPKPNKIYSCQNRLQYWFHKAKWMSNTFPSYNLASELRSRVSGLKFILVLSNLPIVIRNHRHILRLYLWPKSCNFLVIYQRDVQFQFFSIWFSYFSNKISDKYIVKLLI